MSDAAAGLDLSLLIATRRRAAELDRTLATLAAMDTACLRWEVILIDNAGDRETQAVVERFTQALPLRSLIQPVAGKNRALNVALPVASGELIAFTDDDISVDPGWIRELWEGAKRWPDAAMFGGRILVRWPDGHAPVPAHPFFEHAYAAADFQIPEGRYGAGYVWGANMAVRRRIFDEGWRFDERIGPDGSDRYVTGSETSLTVALERLGHQAVYLPRAVVHHHIREEQLTARWLYGRAFRRGRADARRAGLGGGLRAVPRKVIAQAWRAYIAWIVCRLRRDRSGTLDHGIEYWKARGMIHHCRVSAPPRGS